MDNVLKTGFTTLLLLLCISASQAINQKQAAPSLSAHEQRVRNLLELSGFNQQIDEFPNLIKQGVNAAVQADDSAPATNLLQLLNAAIDKAVVPKEFKLAIGSALFNNLNARNLNTLFSWYESDLGKRITQAEVAASSAEAMAEITNTISDLMSKTERVALVQEIDNIVGATDSALRIQANTQLAIVTGMNKVSSPGQDVDIASLNKQIQAQIEQSRASVQQIIIASFVYIYKNFSDEELKRYVKFLSSSSSKKFNRIAMDGIETEMKKAASVIAETLSIKPKTQAQ